jgi:uncharacterized phage-associated protein
MGWAMATVLDVANYILQKTGPMTAMKLQKLVYYSQAWSLVWDEKPLFPEEIQAWAFGPVCPVLYEAHKGEFVLSKDRFSAHQGTLTESGRATIDAVIDGYNQYSAQQLSDLTHSEDPWNKTRDGIEPLVRSERVISHELMAEYYSALASNGAVNQ